MKKTPLSRFLVFACGLLAPVLFPAANAATIEQATISEVVKQVNVIEAATRRQKAAKPQDIFRLPDVMRTGSESRAEMIASDQTVTRVGANTVFSFSPEKREINLQRGSVLFSSPTGKGGGTIKTAAATASVLGTTIIVVVTKNGGFKLLVIEGHAKARLPNGKTRVLSAGQLIIIPPGSTDFGPAYDFRLGEQVAAALLVTGFQRPLPSMNKIKAAIEQQERQLAAGQFVATRLIVGEGGQPVDPNARQEQAALLIAQSEVLTRRAVQQPTLVQQTGALLTGNGPPAFFPLALTTDAAITTLPLDPTRILTLTPAQVQSLFPKLKPPLPSNVTAFLARNTTINTSPILLNLSLAPFAFVSHGTFAIPPNSSFFPSAPTANPLFFITGGAFNATGHVDFLFPGGVTFATGLVDDAPFTLSNVQFNNLSGGLAINAPSYSATNSSVTATGDIAIAARSGGIDIVPQGVNVTTYSSIKGVSLTAATDISISRVNFQALSTSLTAAGDITLQQIAFMGPGVAMQARTINLSNVSFTSGSQVTLASQKGQLAPFPNTGKASMPGFVNYIINVTYDGTPAQNKTGAVGSGMPITIAKHP
jgi:FecR-like protein